VGIALGRHLLFPQEGGTTEGSLSAEEMADAMKKGSKRP